jgi:predicted TIM-barrel fold metal-dependent hydrolase
MAARSTDPVGFLNGTTPRREFLTGIAALTAGMLASANEAQTQAQAQANNPRRVDFHHHYQTPKWTEYANAHGVRVPQFEREPITGTPWTPAIAIEGMDKAGIEIAYTSAATYYTKTGQMTEHGGTPREPETARRLARETNDFGAKLVADSKGRFRLLPVLPVPDIDSCLKEIEYGLDTLKAPGLCLPSSVGNIYMGDPKFARLLEELNRRQVVVHVHPAEPDWSLNLVPGVEAASVWYGVETTVLIVNLLSAGVPTKFPNIRWIFSHAGGAMPYLAGRIIGGGGQGAGGTGGRGAGGAGARGGGARDRVAALTGTPKPGDRLYDIRKFYYDTAQSTNPITMAALKGVVTISEIVFGTDYPWSTMIDHSDGLQRSGFTADELRAIDRENAARLFPGSA